MYAFIYICVCLCANVFIVNTQRIFNAIVSQSKMADLFGQLMEYTYVIVCRYTGDMFCNITKHTYTCRQTCSYIHTYVHPNINA